MADPKVTIWTWFGLRGTPDLSKARGLGAAIGALGGLVVLATVVLVVVEFIAALAGVGFDNRVDQSTAIRNVGLVVAALVSVPFVIWRTSVAQRQAETATDSLFNDKINAASADLHAMRQRSVVLEDGRFGDAIWEADITRRNAAIDRLEGLVKERPAEAIRVARLLSTYVREVSVEHPPNKPTGRLMTSALSNWAHSLAPSRSDLQTAVHVLGRMLKEEVVEASNIDLRTANLQGMDLSGVYFPGCDFSKANFQATNLEGATLDDTTLNDAEMLYARLNCASLSKARLLSANLNLGTLDSANLTQANLLGAKLAYVSFENTDLTGAKLAHASIQGSTFTQAKLDNCDLSFAGLQETEFLQSSMQGTSFIWAKLDEASFKGTRLRGSAVRYTNLANSTLSQDQLDGMFGCPSVVVPAGLSEPESFALEFDSLDDFNTAWRDWQRSIGFDPEDPATWEAPEAQ